MRRRAVFVCCDGLGRGWIRAEVTPFLDRLREASLWCADHHAVFPSVTRASAASIATGCLPARHGLHGNRMGLFENGRIAVRDVGKPDFRDYMRRATGTTLRVPTMAQRVAQDGGFIACSNVSPGAAYFLDPEHFGTLFHRAGAFGPGGVPLEDARALAVTHDLAGDWAMTQRFCTDVLSERRPTIAVMWLANPDLTLHHNPLGSPAHLDALAQAERCVEAVARTVEALRQRGEQILLLVGSDHGQETVGDCVDLEGWMARAGLAPLLEAGDIAVAGQGTAALLYATERGRAALLAVLDTLRREPWVGELLMSEELAARGHAASGGVVAAINLGSRDEPNDYGVRGRRFAVVEAGKPSGIGFGQHGGLGKDESGPFLIVNEPGAGAGAIERRTSIVDIAPTILSFLGLPATGVDGSALINRA
ncbi:MAG TPA: alkaline phosphatase family protein [Xanthobacteraceae bacterium]|nr:alkaline phosphatase family protein [Xanthobacteraceae bacterium]